MSKKSKMKRTNIELDDTLVKEGLKLTGVVTKKELINQAVKDLVRREKQKEILKFKGKIDWVGDLSKMRASRMWR